MARGPLPTGTAVRRNAPTIPTTNLLATGPDRPTPEPPALVEFGPKASAWWEWAWHTPQACAWDDGAIVMVARRATLEDDLHALEHIDVDLAFLVGEEPNEEARNLGLLIGLLIRKLKSLAGGKSSTLREMRELDDRLGLTPKGLAALRWKVVEAEEPKPAAGTAGRRRLTAV